MMRRTRTMGTLALATALAAALTACSDSAAPSSGSGGTAGGSGAFTVGIKFDQPGVGLKQGSSYSGLDVDVATYVATKLGYDAPTFVQAPSAQRESLISTGQVQMVVASYSITDARKEKVSFAGPYFIAGQDLLVRDDDSSITGPDALGGKRLCSVTGSTSAQKIKDQYPDVQLQSFGTYSECVTALAAGTLDAVTTDNTILAGFAAQEQYAGKLKVVGKTFSTEKYGIGLKKGDTALCTKVNDALSAMVSDGSWKKAVDANLGPAGFEIDSAVNPPEPAACS